MLGLLHGYDFGAESLAALLAVPVQEARGLLRGLVRRHLVEPGTVGRFRLHELLSEYAAERLAREDGAAAAAAARRLLNWYLIRVREAAAAIAPATGPACGAAPLSPVAAEQASAGSRRSGPPWSPWRGRRPSAAGPRSPGGSPTPCSTCSGGTSTAPTTWRSTGSASPPRGPRATGTPRR